MKKKDSNGNTFWIWLDEQNKLIAIEPLIVEVVLDQKRARKLGELLTHFAATGRLTRRGK